MPIHVRLLLDKEMELANHFFNRIYSTNRSIENFKWEFLNGPFGKAIYVIAVDDSVSHVIKIVGIQCAIPLELINTNGQTILTAKSEDTLVDPIYRGQKVFERMYELLFEECKKVGIKYIWGFTPAQKAFERIGFEIPFKTEQALMVLKPVKAYQYLKELNKKNSGIDKLKIFGLSYISWIKGAIFRLKKRDEIIEVDLENKNDLFQILYKNEPCFTLNESSTYIKWRIIDNPFRNNYKSFQFKKGNEVIADAIINLRESVSYIEQLTAKPETDITSFITALSKVCISHESPLLRAFCFSSNKAHKEQGANLSKAGFIYLKRGSYFVWKSLDSKHSIKPSEIIINRMFMQGNL